MEIHENDLDYFATNYHGNDVVLQTLSYIIRTQNTDTAWVPKTRITKKVHEAQQMIVNGFPNTISAGVIVARMNKFIDEEIENGNYIRPYA